LHAYYQSRDYCVADTVDFVDSTGDRIEVDFVASVYEALLYSCPLLVFLFMLDLLRDKDTLR